MDMKELLAAVRATVADEMVAHGLKRKSVARADSEDKPEEEKKADSDKPEDEKKADSDKPEEEKKADSDKPEDEKKADNDQGNGEPKETAADKKADAAPSGMTAAERAQMAALQAELATLKKSTAQPSDDDYRAMASAQERADRVAQAFGDSAPRAHGGESLIAYRKRLVGKFAQHSTAYKDVNIAAINDSALLEIVEKQVYADAMDVANSPAKVEAGTLRARVSSDATGRRITSFDGHPSAWTNMFKAPRHHLVGINKQGSM